MAEVNIPMQAMIFRCGWEKKIIHTIFRYVLTSMSNDMRCGKTISNQFYKAPSEIYGSVPPTLDDIQTESQTIHLFEDVLFVNNTGLWYKKKLKHILAASVFQFYDDFRGIILNEPSGKYKDRSHHPFHQNIVFILFEVSISNESFDKWKKEVI